MKSLLRWALRKMGYDIIRHAEMPERPLNVLQLAVDARVATGKSVRFVQVGANDGVRADPMRNLVIRHQLSGVLVEPLPDLFARLQANYARQPGVSFEQCAIGEHDGTMTLYRVRPDAGLPDWVCLIASFDKRHLTSKKFGIEGLEQHVIAVSVPVLTIASLLKKHNLESCDLLQIDTEGFDAKIVMSALRAGLWPAIIHYEHLHVPLGEQAQCKRLLAEAAYAFLDVGGDTLAVRQD